MSTPTVEAQIDSLARQLASFHGYRTVWLDLNGLVCHAEPDEELEALGYLYVGTFLRPTTEALEEAMARYYSVVPEPAPVARKLWDGLSADLTPAEA